MESARTWATRNTRAATVRHQSLDALSTLTRKSEPTPGDNVSFGAQVRYMPKEETYRWRVVLGSCTQREWRRAWLDVC